MPLAEIDQSGDLPGQERTEEVPERKSDLMDSPCGRSTTLVVCLCGKDRSWLERTTDPRQCAVRDVAVHTAVTDFTT